ncbi:hypothetical protein CDD80_6001 [Ophiocordyceps camponoti-rufipedis]|uniref:C2H2-type domain-containing protein n=1 Tax=Ophiocordyceps camponoti-rufipedis TaxID=2004952 RepID=A0A2C5YTV1_9HYPO|nr:hypothetical protein CDD80_6001 [Ophiocordyceps camponoti-rufipedis]
MGNPSFLSPFTSAMSEQPQGGQVFNQAPYHASMQPSYGVTMEYPAAYGEYSTRMPLSHEAGMLYPMQSVSTSGGQEDSQFSTFSNLLRHQREKSGQAAKATCPNCGAEFTRTTARNGHLLHEKCKQRRNT